MRTAKLSDIEKSYILDNLFIPLEIRRLLLKTLSVSSVIEVGDNVAESIRSVLTDRLANSGFDENYLLNKEGLIIENLIDKRSER